MFRPSPPRVIRADSAPDSSSDGSGSSHSVAGPSTLPDGTNAGQAPVVAGAGESMIQKMMADK